MIINYLKNKTYHILVSLFCLCYALGVQQVAAASRKGQQDNARKATVNKGTFSMAKNGKFTVKTVDNKQVNNVKPFLQDPEANIMFLTGQLEDEWYILATENTLIISAGLAPKGSFTDIKFTLLPYKQFKVEEQVATKVNAYRKSSFWGSSFIYMIPGTSQAFYYRNGWLGVDYRKATPLNDHYYAEALDRKANSGSWLQWPFSRKRTMWEVRNIEKGKKQVIDTESNPVQEITAEDEQAQNATKEIVDTWHVTVKDAKKIKAHKEGSQKGWIFHTISIESSWLSYWKLTNGSTIIGSCILVLAIAIAAFHKKVISGKKVREGLSRIFGKHKETI